VRARRGADRRGASAAHGSIHVSVEDFDRWKPVFDEDGVNRERASSRGGYVCRNRANPNELVVLLEFTDAAHMEAFSQSPGLHEAMARSGVVGTPDIAFLDLADRPDRWTRGRGLYGYE
jgi:hypothetical protein